MLYCLYRVKRWTQLCVFCMLSACTTTHKGADGHTISYVVLGFGIVTVPAQEKTKAINISSHTGIGIIASYGVDASVTVGYSEGTLTQVGKGAPETVFEYQKTSKIEKLTLLTVKKETMDEKDHEN